jgi:ABC-type glycerol-3-phosphate transport system permease component
MNLNSALPILDSARIDGHEQSATYYKITNPKSMQTLRVQQWSHHFPQ